MSFEQVRQALATLEVSQRREQKELTARVEALLEQLAEAKTATVEAQEKAERARETLDSVKTDMGRIQERAVKDKGEAASTIVTLAAEKEIIAARDRDSRNELDRLRKTKK